MKHKPEIPTNECKGCEARDRLISKLSQRLDEMELVIKGPADPPKVRHGMLKMSLVRRQPAK